MKCFPRNCSFGYITYTKHNITLQTTGKEKMHDFAKLRTGNCLFHNLFSNEKVAHMSGKITDRTTESGIRKCPINF
jgi:hypothetical protein